MPLAPEPLVACLLAQSDVVPRHALLRLGTARADSSPSTRAWAALLEGADDEDEDENEERDMITDYLLRALDAPTPAFETALLSDGALVTETIQRLSQSLPGGLPKLLSPLNNPCATPHRPLQTSESTRTAHA